MTRASGFEVADISHISASPDLGYTKGLKVVLGLTPCTSSAT